MTDVTTILQMKYPMIVGPMAWTSTAPLVAAVANAGALGVLGVGFSPSEVVEEQIKATQALTDQPFAINVVIGEPMEAEIARVTAIASKYHVAYIYADTLDTLNVDFTKKWFNNWHQKGFKVVTKIGTAPDAAVADQCGADIIVAKGVEGGGHMSFVGTLALVPQVADVVHHAALVASGGIVDGRGYAASRLMGATGVEMGTAFLAASEGAINANVKDAVVNATTEDVVMTGYSTGAPCWQIKNHLSEKLTQIENTYVRKEAAAKVAELSSGSLRISSQEGEIEEQGAIMPGQAVTLVKATRSVADILADVYTDGVKRLQQVAQFRELNE